MARDKSAIQDRLLSQFDKQNKKTGSERDNTPKTLEEQLKDSKKASAMAPDEALRSKPYEKWKSDLYAFMHESRQVPTRIVDTIFFKQKADMEKFHKEGTSYKKILDWIKVEGNKYF